MLYGRLFFIGQIFVVACDYRARWARLCANQRAWAWGRQMPNRSGYIGGVYAGCNPAQPIGHDPGTESLLEVKVDMVSDRGLSGENSRESLE